MDLGGEGLNIVSDKRGVLLMDGHYEDTVLVADVDYSPKDGLRGECPRWRARWLKLDAVSGVHIGHVRPFQRREKRAAFIVHYHRLQPLVHSRKELE